MKNPTDPKKTIQERGVIQGIETLATTLRRTNKIEVKNITDSNPIAILLVF
jgi:hypothetical protein